MKKIILLLITFQFSGILFAMDQGNKELEALFARPSQSAEEANAMLRLTGDSRTLSYCSPGEGRLSVNNGLVASFGSPEGLRKCSRSVQREVKSDTRIVLKFLSKVEEAEANKK